jgi:RNA polymerase sigma-70 factor, ECF subfamily
LASETRIHQALARRAFDEAATETIRTYGPQILGYLTRVLGSPDVAADAFSLFSEQLWKGMARFEGRSSMRVWAYRVAWSAALRVASEGYRQRRTRLRTSMASRLAAEVLSTAAGASPRADDMDELRGQLTPAERALLVLRLDHQLPWAEVAEMMSADGEPVDAALLRKRFERLKEKLAELARRRGMLG